MEDSLLLVTKIMSFRSSKPGMVFQRYVHSSIRLRYVFFFSFTQYHHWKWLFYFQTNEMTFSKDSKHFFVAQSSGAVSISKVTYDEASNSIELEDVRNIQVTIPNFIADFCFLNCEINFGWTESSTGTFWSLFLHRILTLLSVWQYLNLSSCLHFVESSLLRYFATGGADATIAFWSAEDMVCIRVLHCLE